MAQEKRPHEPFVRGLCERVCHGGSREGGDVGVERLLVWGEGPGEGVEFACFVGDDDCGGGGGVGHCAGTAEEGTTISLGGDEGGGGGTIRRRIRGFGR